MAIAARIIGQILLMVIFSRIKILQRFCFHYYRARILFPFPVYGLLDDGTVSGIGIINSCPILGADIIALPVDGGRVNCFEIITVR